MRPKRHALRASALAGAALAVCVSAAASAAAVAGAASSTPVTIFVSRATGSHGKAADGPSRAPAISKRGRYVVFSSTARNLSGSDRAKTRDVFLRDLDRHRTELVSRVTGLSGKGADKSSDAPSISGDGRYVAFESRASGLGDAQDTPQVTDVFVRDRGLRTTTLVSRATGTEGQAGDFDSRGPAISANGRFVAFESNAENLSPVDDARYTDIFVRDLRGGSTRLVDRAPGTPGPGADGNAARPAISADGRYVAFDSNASNLSKTNDDKFTNVYVRDTRADHTILVSRVKGPHGTGADGDSADPSISADGRYVAFESSAPNLSQQDDDSVVDVFVRDLKKNRTILVSRANGRSSAGGNLSSRNPSISSDGRFVAFDSLANDLSTADDDAHTGRNVYVRDLTGGRTSWVSRAKGDAKFQPDSVAPAIAGDGSAVAFQSNAANLSAEDRDPQLDVFVFPLANGSSAARPR
jgi:Tol biopolymer transport system component